jgi:hypothetical protein
MFLPERVPKDAGSRVLGLTRLGGYMLMRNRFGWLMLFVCLSTPIVALAQGRPIGLNDRAGGRDHAIELELDVSIASEDGPNEATYTTILPKVYGSFGLTEDLELEVTIPTVFEDYSPDEDTAEDEGDSTLLLANPYFALFYADRTLRSAARIGFGVALPVLDPDDAIDGLASVMAIGTRGFMDMWLYMPERLSLVVPGQLQARVSSFVLGVDAAVAAMIPTGDNDSADTELAVQAGALFGIGLGDTTIGMRLQVGAIPTADGNDDAQASLMPFVQVDLDGGAFIHGGVLVNLDDPFGVAGDNTIGLWALRVGGGGRF